MHAVTFHAVGTQMKCMHMFKQGVGEWSEPHSLYYIIIASFTSLFSIHTFVDEASISHSGDKEQVVVSSSQKHCCHHRKVCTV